MPYPPVTQLEPHPSLVRHAVGRVAARSGGRRDGHVDVRGPVRPQIPS